MFGVAKAVATLAQPAGPALCVKRLEPFAQDPCAGLAASTSGVAATKLSACEGLKDWEFAPLQIEPKGPRKHSLHSGCFSG
jgi:hypothetical protein